MSSNDTVSSIHQPVAVLCKSIAVIGLILFIFYTLFFFNHDRFSDQLLEFQVKWPNKVKTSEDHNNVTRTLPPTTLSHIGFVVISSLPSWKPRKAYIEAWWRPNITRGYVFLDGEPTQDFLPWPPTSPPFRVNNIDDVKFPIHPNLRIQIRMFHSILDRYRIGELEGLRWIVMADDDTLLLVDNLVEVLSKYDHNKFVYIGANSECVKSNFDFSFDMGFGGAGFALSYPLFEALSTQIFSCIERYAGYIQVYDHMVQSCVADLGVAINIERGIHQIDLHSDISGLLSSHPQSPFVSLHHFDTIDPIFPSMDRGEAVQHLMKAAKHDQSRVLQQTICYQRQSNWSFSVSWGYSTHIYENIIPRSILRKPLETFRPWSGNFRPFYMFNTRWLTNYPCEAPHVFFLQSVNYSSGNDHVVTTYTRASLRNLPPCSLSGNHSADSVTEIRVLSPAIIPKVAGVIECCDVEYKSDSNVTEIKLRSCMKNEVIA